jgi:hypothetical protein
MLVRVEGIDDAADEAIRAAFSIGVRRPFAGSALRPIGTDRNRLARFVASCE